MGIAESRSEEVRVKLGDAGPLVPTVLPRLRNLGDVRPQLHRALDLLALQGVWKTGPNQLAGNDPGVKVCVVANNRGGIRTGRCEPLQHLHPVLSRRLCELGRNAMDPDTLLTDLILSGRLDNVLLAIEFHARRILLNQGELNKPSGAIRLQVGGRMKAAKGQPRKGRARQSSGFSVKEEGRHLSRGVGLSGLRRMDPFSRPVDLDP